MAVKRATFRLYPTKQVEQKLYYHRRLHKDLYNAAVYNRFTQYQKFSYSVDYLEQQNCLPAFKEVWVEYKEVGSHALQATLKRVDYAFGRWFKGLSKKPRYKSIRHYSGWTYPDRQSWKCHSTGDNGYLELDKIGSIQMRRKQAPNCQKKVKASRRWKKAQRHVTKLQRKVACYRQNWVHQVATKLVNGNRFVATEKLEVKKMTRQG